LTEAAIVFVPALLVAAFGVTSSRASFMLLPVVFAMAVGAPVSGRALDHIGSRIVVCAGCTLIGIGLLFLATVAHTMLAFYAAGVVTGLGLAALLGSSLRYVMLNEAPPNQRAATQGLLTLFTSTGQLLGAAAVGAIVASHGSSVFGFDVAFDVIGVCMLLLAAAAIGLKSRKAELAAHAYIADAAPAGADVTK
ncbi:MAG TPA: MFS transporter, partial [Longimicrobiales bacterium]|nr:MFS transporter [Longimicrobiales bacterium]